MTPTDLDDHDRGIYGWQMDLPGFGEAAQRRLKGASVLISRCGGLGGVAALQLAAAGVGRLVIAHAGKLKPSDLHRQVLQQADRVGRPRLESIRERLRALNPRVEVVAIPENPSPENADRLVGMADVVIDAAPRFEERLALNDAAVRLGRPMVEASMHAWEAHVTVLRPGDGPCLRCLVPEVPSDWTRRFPVLGAVSGTAGCIAAAEAVKLLTGLGQPLVGRLLVLDLLNGTTRRLHLACEPDCPVCARAVAAQLVESDLSLTGQPA